MAPKRQPADLGVKAAIYARVSSDDGRQSTANQLQQLRELASVRQFEIVREYVDEETGTSASRPWFLALLRDARLRRFRVLLISDLDRLTREGAAAGFGYLAELDRFGVRVISLGQSWLDYDPAVDEDAELREMRSIQTAVALTWASLERQKISRRTKAGLERARSQGKRLGRRPVDATPAQISRLLAKGLSITEIASKLHISRRTAYRLRHRISLR
jgi:DNA invertase Pin-like site-specific DNA recombinase